MSEEALAIDDELMQGFIVESREHLATIEADLLTIEQAGEAADPELVNKVFRAAHSIKGCSGFLGLNKVKELAHRAETVLDMLRSHKMRPNAEVTNILLSAFDKLSEMVNAPAGSELADTSLELRGLIELADSYVPQSEKSVATAAAPGQTAEIYALNLPQTCGVDTRPADQPAIEISPVIQPPTPRASLESGNPTETRSTAPPSPGSTTASIADDTLRVNVGLLDTLMNLAGELVLSRNQFQAGIAQHNHRMLTSAGQRLSQVTSEIQDAIMRTRLQPIENVFSKLPRVVRDLSNSLHKEVTLDLRGKDVALDRSLVEGLSDPLTHMVRNAIDHGIESPADRLRAGKSSAGNLRVEARHEAGQVVIEIADDGKGIDSKRVAQAALARGLITAEGLKAMNPQDEVSLILLPGLSTAEKVSDVSGRGVGMDVVKTNLDRLGGQLEISSTQGQGSTFRIKLPLTLTIIPALIVSVEGGRFAIPQINVEELLRIRPEEAKRRIEVLGGSEVLLLRDRILPLLRLDDFLGKIPTYTATPGGGRSLDRRFRVADRRSPRVPAQGEPEPGSSRPGPIIARESEDRRGPLRGALEIAVITTGRFQYGLAVQSFHNTEEIVVKPLGHHLKESREYAGATILGDGAVALILDAAGLAARAEVTAVAASQHTRELEDRTRKEAGDELNKHAMLLFRNTPEEYCAIPLGTVRRIERIKPEQVEMAGGRRTMRYRDQSLPLVTLSDTAQVQPLAGAKDFAVIVSNIYGHEVGLLGAMPVDVAEAAGEIDSSTHRQRGIAGSSVLGGKTTLIADLVELVDAVYPEWKGESSGRLQLSTTAVPEDKPTILLAEDSDFFRNQLKRFLESDGYAVLDAADGEIAWSLLQKNSEKVQLVVTDIEMPNMSGLDLTRHIRSDVRVSRLPVIAVTSLASDEDMAMGRKAGIDEYQIKLDRDALMGRVHTLLAAPPRNGNPIALATAGN